MSSGSQETAVHTLDLDNPHIRAAFEQAFYRAFVELSHNQLVRQLWNWDTSNERLSTRIPYSRQKIFAQYGPQGAIEAACAVNLDTSELQSSFFGFQLESAQLLSRQINSSSPLLFAEFLVLFAIQGDRSLLRRKHLWRKTFLQLRSEGYTHGLATCSPAVWSLYRRMGASLIEQKKIDAETRYFIVFGLDQFPD